MTVKKILWMTWKDKSHPETGGAEVVNEELAKRLANDGFEVVFLVGGFKNCKSEEHRNGFKIIRVGNKFSVYLFAYLYYKKNLKGKFDLVIDEMNTIPFFAKFYVKEKNFLFVHQLCREIWFYQMPLIVSFVGYILEPIYLFCLRNSKVITVSNSTKNDLIKYGFKKENINIISEGIEFEPIENLQVTKFEIATILSLGSIRPMKRTLEIVKAFEIVKKNILNAQLIIAGDNSGLYAKKVLRYINNSKFKNDILVKGKVSINEKINLMQMSHVLAVTSIKEGWGLVVTEANSQGTPAVVYNVDGLRDSVKNNETGLVTLKNNHNELGKCIVEILNNDSKYELLRENAYKFSNQINFEKSYFDFLHIMTIYTSE